MACFARFGNENQLMMKCCFVILMLSVFALNHAAQDNRINWQTDYAAALSEARKSGKPIMLDFTAKWCAPCQEMEKTFWTRPDVAEAMKSFVAVKIDYDAEKKLVNRFAVRGLPYIAFSDPIGNLITYRNRLDADGATILKQISTDLPKDFSALEKAYKAYDLNDRDGSALLEIADFYADANMYSLSNSFYKRALLSAQIQTDANKKERAAAALGRIAFYAGDYRQAIKYAEDYLKIFPSGKNKESSYLILTMGNAELGNLIDAETYLQKLKTEFPRSSNLRLAVNGVEKAKNKKSSN